MTDEQITEGGDGQLYLSTPLTSRLDTIQREQAAGFASLGKALEGKADRVDLAKIETRLDEHGNRLSAVESWKHDREVAGGVHQQRDDQVLTRRQKVWGAIGIGVIAGASVLGGILSAVLSHH